ncbi:hypothetical protein [Enterovibrio baiacu]|uniref:hypothetical protein n=1 Tax=Enterovibrio baiacu TaxID=2491023 RepID=UPI0010101543|nr:hypothetical protein [Enterovibrio baiacu]MBE1275013.1 hypothetical protein [Enterovibrio baiacu]
MSSCSANCKCRCGTIAFVFVPGIMGTRLKNAGSGKSVWDPAAGMEFSGPSSHAEEIKAEREAELEAAQPDSSDRWYWETPGKWLQRRWIGVKDVGHGASEKVRRGRTTVALVPRVSDLLFSGPLARKKLLVDANTKKQGPPISQRNDDLLDIDEGTDDYFRVYTSVPKSQMAMKRERGWGEVHWDSYGPLLRYLEQKAPALKKDFPGIEFPVFAVGYNWMLSNEEAGKRLKEKLATFKKQLLDEDKAGPNRGITDSDIKFIVISHSMGGFASRAGFKLSGVESDVEAVIHGAMPTHGSPSTYRQFRAGAVGGGAAKFILGKNAADTAAILGFCQGGLELLPNQLYVDAKNNSEWLFANTSPSQSSSHRQSLISYGASVFSFYKKFDKWYSMVQPVLLAPELAGVRNASLEKHIDAYSDRINKIKKFHLSLAAQFHATTALIYSNNPDTKAFDHCEWRRVDDAGDDLSKAPIDSLHVYSDENHQWFGVDGDLGLLTPATSAKFNREFDAWIQNQRYSTRQYPSSPPKAPAAKMRLEDESANGDGTVQEGAGLYPSGVLTEGLKATEEHQGFYNCNDVRDKMMVYLEKWVADIHQQFAGP